jgi:hypothetical protein
MGAQWKFPPIPGGPPAVAPIVVPPKPEQPVSVPTIPRGYEIIKVAPSSGDPGVPAGGRVVVDVKAWTSSGTIWASIAGLGLAILDAVIEVLIPYLTTPDPIDFNKLWRPVLVGAFSAFVAWRRKNDNTVVGSN